MVHNNTKDDKEVIGLVKLYCVIHLYGSILVPFSPFV